MASSSTRRFTPFNVVGLRLGPQAFLQMAGVFALCLVVVRLLFKELKIAAFDPEMATAVGINADSDALPFDGVGFGHDRRLV